MPFLHYNFFFFFGKIIEARNRVDVKGCVHVTDLNHHGAINFFRNFYFSKKRLVYLYYRLVQCSRQPWRSEKCRDVTVNPLPVSPPLAAVDLLSLSLWLDPSSCCRVRFAESSFVYFVVRSRLGPLATPATRRSLGRRALHR